MQEHKAGDGPVLRLFEVTTKPGRADELLRSFATTSAGVVKGHPGNKGYFFGRGILTDGDTVVFASIWTDLEAVKARFGDAWQESFLPPGYEDMIDACSIRHIDMTGGWYADLSG